MVLQGPNPFLDNFYGLINPELGDYLPYSQIYNVKNTTTDGNSFLFLRYLKILNDWFPSLSYLLLLGTIFICRVLQKKRFKASRYIQNLYWTKYPQLNIIFQVAASEGSGSNFNGISSQKIIISDAPVQSTIVETQKSMSRKQSSKLLGQMESVVGSQKVDFFNKFSFIWMIVMRRRFLGLLISLLDMLSSPYTRHWTLRRRGWWARQILTLFCR